MTNGEVKSLALLESAMTNPTQSPEVLAQKAKRLPSILRAMAENYSAQHNWDRLDAAVCVAAANTIDALAALAKAELDECDECGTPYSFDPTDGGSICVACQKDELTRLAALARAGQKEHADPEEAALPCEEVERLGNKWGDFDPNHGGAFIFSADPATQFNVFSFVQECIDAALATQPKDNG